jgi:dTDP-4-amino-4,6-dideoxygalactose transaminase
LSSEILKQVLANDDTVPLLCAIAYQQLAELTARTSGWKEATTYFEKSLEQLREPEQSIGWQNPQWTLAFSAWHRSRAECALDLARLANANKDVDRAKVAINFLENTKLEMTTFQRQELNYMKETLGTTYLIHDTVKPQVVPSAPQSPSR